MRWLHLPWVATLLVMGVVVPAVVHADGPSEPRGESLRPHRAGPERAGRGGPGSRDYRDSLPRDERKRLRRMEAEERRAEMRERAESMSPEERRALRLGRRERERGPGRRPHAGWKSDIEALAPGEREALHEQMRGLSPEEGRDVLRDRFGDPEPPPPGEMGPGRPGSDSRRRVEDYLDSLPEDERQQLRSEIKGLEPRERRQVMRDRFRNLPAEERERLRERFRSLGPEDRERMRDRMRAENPRARRQLWAEDGEIDPTQRRAQHRAMRENVGNLPEAERQQVREQLRRYRELSPGEQQQLRERLREVESMSPQRREQLRERAETWRALPEAKRDRLRSQMRRLNELQPEERLELLDSVLDGEGGELGEPDASLD